ncbi:hypothetical protein [Streptomyces sp. 6N223]|uniref:hypothetical protein n=1 Tax=Streptomyces sp. 6N223 TaxID=3457412 RepID=UPI003FD397C0
MEARARVEDLGSCPPTPWITGFLGERDLAFAVVLEDCGSGGSDAGPVAADFLNALNSPLAWARSVHAALT